MKQLWNLEQRGARGTSVALIAALIMMSGCSEAIDTGEEVAAQEALEADEVEVLEQEVINGNLSSSNTTDNAVLWLNGCSGALVAPDMVLTVGHCSWSADWSEDATVGVGTWRPMEAQPVRVGPNPNSPLFTTTARWKNQAGFDDISLYLLDQPVPASIARPVKVMTAADYATYGSTLNGKSLRVTGYGSECSGWLSPRKTWTVDNAGGTPRGVNSFAGSMRTVNGQRGAIEGGDSGAPLLWYSSAEGVTYVVGVTLGYGAGDGTCSSTGRYTPHFLGTFRQGDGSTKPDLSAWLDEQVVPSQRRTIFAPFQGPDRWHEWFCVGNEVCDVGDFNGDGKDDIITFVRSSYGHVYVGKSYGWRSATGDPYRPQSGRGFESALWHDNFGYGSEQVGVIDFNGDGKDDIWAGSPWALWITLSNGDAFGAPFQAVTSGVCATGAKTCLAGQLLTSSVAQEMLSFDLSSGSASVWRRSGSSMSQYASFSTSAISGRCQAPERCELADFDGDGDDDLYLIREDSTGNVDVALNAGSGFQTPFRLMSGRCYKLGAFTTTCSVTDVDRDGREDDVVVFSHDQQRVHVAITPPGSTQATMSYHWAINFCPAGYVCKTGDFTGDGLGDIVGFVRSADASKAGDVFVQSSLDSF